MKKKELLKRIEYLENQISVLSNKINPKHKYTSPYDPKYLKTVLPQDYKTDYIEVANYDTTATLFNEEKKELVIGKWYFCELDNEIKFLFCFSGEYGQFTQYGFNVKGEWSNQLGCIQGLKYIEATHEEVESALITEAKRMGHKYDAYSWNHEQNTLYGNRGNDVGHDILFENGVWSDVKPEEKPKVGDVCKFWDWDENVYTVARLEGVRENSSFPYAADIAVLYKNAKTITQQEAIDLLFNK